VSDRLVRFPGSSWQEIEALPQPLRWTVQRTIFHLLDEPVPTLADPFPSESEEGRGRRVVPAALSNPRPADYEKYGLHHRRTHRDPRTQDPYVALYPHGRRLGPQHRGRVLVFPAGAAQLDQVGDVLDPVDDEGDAAVVG
jgi:hypothetical protein